MNDRDQSNGPDDPDESTEPSSEVREAAALAEENARLRAELEAEKHTAQRSRRGRWRRVAAIFLVVMTSLSVVTAAVGIWTQRTLASTDRYVALVAPLAQNRAVTDALATKLTDQVFVALDIQARVEDTITAIPNAPSQITLLVGPITAGARSLIQDAAEKFLASDRFDQLWTGLNRALHPKLQALLNGDYEELPNVSVNGGEVRLNLVPAVAEVIRRLAQGGLNDLGIDATIPTIPAGGEPSEAIQRLGSAVGVSLPDDFGQVTIMTADDLASYQDAIRTIKRLVLGIFLLSILLLIVTIVVAPDRRRAVIWLGAGIAITLFLSGVFLRRAEASLVESIDGPGAKAAAQQIFDEVSTGLRGVGLWVMAIALVAAFAAHLIGRPRWFVRSLAWGRRITTQGPTGSELEIWVAQRADAARIVVLAAAALVLFLTGIDWVPVILVGLLLALSLWGIALAEQRGHASGPAAGESLD